MMNSLKKTAAFALLTLSSAFAVAQPADVDFERLYVFGDSLSDPGNAFSVTGQTANPPFDPIPSAAYGVGGHHFTNGKTWIEVLARNLKMTEDAKPAFRDPAYGNFAFGGARVATAAVPGFDTQVGVYQAINGCNAGHEGDSLYVVQFGGNDLRDALLSGDPATINAIIAAAVGGIATNMGTLASCGARKFLVATAPNLGAAPAVDAPFKPIATFLSAQLNGALVATVNANFPAALGFEIRYIDFFDFTTRATQPGAFGFSNNTTPCLSFGTTVNAFCEDRDGHLFWDVIHPTKIGHALLAGEAFGVVTATKSSTWHSTRTRLRPGSLFEFQCQRRHVARMTKHEYIFIAISIILGLAMARLLHNAALLVRAHDRLTFHWATTLWSICIFIYILLLWWVGWELRLVAEWSFLDFFALVIGSIFVYGAAELALPTEDYDISDNTELDFLAHSRSLGRVSAASMLGYFAVGPYVNLTMFNNPPLPFLRLSDSWWHPRASDDSCTEMVYGARGILHRIHDSYPAANRLSSRQTPAETIVRQ